MGNTDSIPVISQAKSGVQLICGDTEGAARTQEHFFHECPIVSQGTSIGYLLAGNTDAALETQKRCGQGLLNAADGIPVVGHVKGVIHYAAGDKEGGHKAMKSATRTTGVIAGGVGGFFVGGPVGAVAGGVYGGAVTDAGTTLVTGNPSGYIAAIENAKKNPNPGDIFDLCLMPVADGFAGYSAGSVVQRLTAPKPGATVVSSQGDLIKAGELRSQAAVLYEAAESQSGLVPEIQTLTDMRQVSKLWNAADALEGKVRVSMKATTTTGRKVVIAPTSVNREADSSQKQRQKQRQQSQQQRERRTKAEEEESSSSSSEDEECICEEVEATVVYANMRSVNPLNKSLSMETKLERLKDTIKRNQPSIVAIVETWLSSGHSDVDVAKKLGLSRHWVIWRQDRDAGHHDGNAYGDTSTGMEGRRGGGILIAWKPTTLGNGSQLSLVRNPSEDYGDNIMSADIITTMNCGPCNSASRLKRFAFTVVYRRPVPSGDRDAEDRDIDVRNRLTHLGAAYRDDMLDYSGWSLVGDFNWWEGGESAYAKELLTFVADIAAVFPDPTTRTHQRGGCLDLVIASNDHVNGVVVSREPISDHHALVYRLNFGHDFNTNEPCDPCSNDSN